MDSLETSKARPTCSPYFWLENAGESELKMLDVRLDVKTF